MTWEDAKDAAEGMSITIDGVQMQGHLATITSDEENKFIYDNLNVGNSWLGGYQPADPTKANEPNGEWAWVTGETWDYTSWASNEPNNYPHIAEGEDCLVTWGTYVWNDYAATFACTFIVEYEPIESNEPIEEPEPVEEPEPTDPSIPEFPSIVLPIAAILGLSAVIGRRKV